ncbi:NAD-dependent histone deacetylase HST3 [Diaporthe amygdali]|uniref:NAD-dependent histone deacetylase HST3 n=1 Tax=Phomopsis amygdali TaxID=1214568 RepID=UPI0022FDB719|nr:NAD-dependent histone deacetylase HST3 [Diaporthe amygdali]KAJ0103718.1 NAD-dependent histone deacetylase HST3 [Diaporthe amygdali]
MSTCLSTKQACLVLSNQTTENVWSSMVLIITYGAIYANTFSIGEISKLTLLMDKSCYIRTAKLVLITVRQLGSDGHRSANFSLILYGSASRIIHMERKFFRSELVKRFAKAVRANGGLTAYIGLTRPRSEFRHIFDYSVEWDCDNSFRYLKEHAAEAFMSHNSTQAGKCPESGQGLGAQPAETARRTPCARVAYPIGDLLSEAYTGCLVLARRRRITSGETFSLQDHDLDEFLAQLHSSL